MKAASAIVALTRGSVSRPEKRRRQLKYLETLASAAALASKMYGETAKPAYGENEISVTGRRGEAGRRGWRGVELS